MKKSSAPETVRCRFLRRSLLFIVACCLPMAALPVQAEVSRVAVVTELMSRSADAEDLRSVAIGARAISSTGEEHRAEVRFDGIPMPGGSVLGLDGSYVWELTLDAPGFWAARQIVPLGGSAVRFKVWPTGEISGDVIAAEGEEEPDEIQASFESTPRNDGGSGSADPKGSTICPIVENHFSCEVPASALDLKLRAKGFVSHFYWNTAVQARERRDLGTLTLRPGASVVGSVVADGGELSRETCRIALAPEVAGEASTFGEHRRQASAEIETRVNDRGFFHFEGVAPGSYRVSVSQPGFATAKLAPVAVVPRAETMIRRPLVLQRPVDLEVFLSPPTDAFGKPWSLEVKRQGRIPGTLDPAGEGTADLAGSFVLRGLDPGSYVVAVRDSEGSRFAWEEVELSRSSGPQQIALDVLWAEGSISIGTEPLEGRLTFGGRTGTTQIAMASDEEGIFGGFLPRSGDWEVFVESDAQDVSCSVVVAVEPGDDGSATLEIELPDTRVEGEVVDAGRRPVEGAIVKAAEAETATITWRRSVEDGKFRFRGLAEGTVVIDATLGKALSSDPAVLQLSQERSGPSLTLVLQEKASLTGRVVSSSGPVPGALVVVTPKHGGMDYPFSLLPHTVTNPLGEFTLEVPKDADRLDLVVMPPGFALTTAVLAGPPSESVEVAVEEYSGNLELELGDDAGPPGERGAPFPIVLRGGVTLDPSILRRWASLKLEENADPSRLRVPAMPPGEYSACWLSYESLAAALARGNVPAPGDSGGGRCVDGFLPPYGELNLSLPHVSEHGETEGPVRGASSNG